MPIYQVHYVYKGERKIHTINANGHVDIVEAQQVLVEFLNLSRKQGQTSFQKVLESHGAHISNIEPIENG